MSSAMVAGIVFVGMLTVWGILPSLLKKRHARREEKLGR